MMGLLYNILLTIEERGEHMEEPADSSRETIEHELSRHPKSLIELLSEPIGKKERENKY